MYLYRKGMSYKLFTFYLVYVLAVETGFHVLRNMYVNNIFLAHYYFIGQAVLLNLFYFRLLESGRLKRMQLITTAVLSMAVIVNIAIRKHNNETFDLLEVVLCNTSVVVCMLLYLYDRIDKVEEKAKEAEKKVDELETMGQEQDVPDDNELALRLSSRTTNSDYTPEQFAAVRNAIVSSKYTYRTVAGIVKDAHLTIKEVTDILNIMKSDGYAISKKNKKGNDIWRIV